MRYAYGVMRPGKVMQVLEDGVIKASAPGLFSDQDDPELLPPIYPPFFTPHANAFSSVKVGDEVWILNFTGNSLQLHWFRKDYEYIITLLSVFEENLNEIINKPDLVYINIEIAPNYNNKENVIAEIKEALKAAMDPTRLALMCKYMDDNDGDTDYYLWNMGFENIYQYISDLT